MPSADDWADGRIVRIVGDRVQVLIELPLSDMRRAMSALIGLGVLPHEPQQPIGEQSPPTKE